MSDEKVSDLIKKYRAGDANEEDLLLIEGLIGQGKLNLDQFDDLTVLESQIDRLETPSPSLDLDDRFYAVLADEKRATRKLDWTGWFSFNTTFTQLALGSVTFIVGLAIGFLLFSGKTTGPSEKMTELTDEVRNLREMMMLTLLEKESATDRLKAVSLSQEMSQTSDAVTKALVKTLNNDENVNVRLAALDALRPYVGDSKVRQELIHSISKQDSPLVQIALADLMASIQEKSSVKEFDKLLKDERTPGDVKTRIRKSIEVLI